MNHAEEKLNRMYRRAWRLLLISVIGWSVILVSIIGFASLSCEESSITERVAVLIASKEIRAEGNEPVKTIIVPGSVTVVDAYGTRAMLNTAGVKFYDKNGTEIQKIPIPHIDMPKE